MARWRAHRSGKRDKNHKEIQDGLEKIGCKVFDTTRVGYGFPDMIVVRDKRIILFEVKTAKGKLKDDQKRFFEFWPGECYEIHSLEEALLVIEKIHQ